MHVEILYFPNCPSYEELVPRVRALIARVDGEVELELREVPDAEVAERVGFLGSPSVRVNGEDIDPTAAKREDFGMKCRLYATPHGLRGLPPDEWVLDALTRR